MIYAYLDINTAYMGNRNSHGIIFVFHPGKIDGPM